jgi:hypothetical protein
MRKLDITVNPSRYFIFFGLAATVGGLLICLTLPLGFFLKIFLLGCVLAYGWHLIFSQALQHHSQAIVKISYESERWFLHTRTHSGPANLCGDSTMTGFLSILRFNRDGVRKKQSCVIFKDALEPDFYRRLITAVRTAEIA